MNRIIILKTDRKNLRIMILYESDKFIAPRPTIIELTSSESYDRLLSDIISKDTINTSLIDTEIRKKLRFC